MAGTPLCQIQLAGGNQKAFAYQILAVAAEALREYPDSRVRSLKDLEEVQQLRLVLGSPAKSGENDPDGVGLVDWQLAIYSGAGGVEAALNFIRYILEYKVKKGYVPSMPGLAARLLQFSEPIALPAPWQELADDSVSLPKPFEAHPPKGRRHVLMQLDRQEQDGTPASNNAEQEKKDGDAAYLLTFFGGIYHFKERFENHNVPGALLPTGKTEKRDYVRYLECGGGAAAEDRVRGVLGSVLLGLPVFFINGVGGGDPMSAWLLRQPSVIDGESTTAEGEASPVAEPEEVREASVPATTTQAAQVVSID